MNNLRIIFMGTPDFAVGTLKHLVANNCKIVGVVTAPDKPAGRGQKLNESAVKKYAMSQDLLILQPRNLKEAAFINELKNLKANLQIVVAFRMLPKVIWQMPQLGTFNLHASLLPQYRGAAPIHWALINGETKTGVSTFFIDDQIDTGELILQDEIAITADETVGTLHDKLMILGANLVLETVHLIANKNVVTQKQPDVEEKKAPKLTSANTQINWNDSLNSVYNKIRGLNPFPTAWTVIENNEQEIFTKIYGVQKIKQTHNLEPGTIVSTKNELKVAVKNGFIRIDEIKLSGKKKMDAKSLLNGFTFSKNARMLSAL